MEQNVKRRASVPKLGMPSGYSLRVALSIFWDMPGCISPYVRFLTSSSTAIPSIKSIGSSTLPFDFDILWPSASRIRPWMYTSLNGTSPVNFKLIITIRETQKKMISNPVIKTLVGKNVLSLSVFCGQPNVENGHNAEENQVSNTSSS